MARTEARLFCAIWTDPDWRQLPPDAQWLYMLLLSQADLTQAGTIGLSVRRWASASPGMTVERVTEALRVLDVRRYVLVDSETEEALVRSVLRRDGAWKSHKTLVYAARAAEAVLSPRLRAALLAEARRVDPSQLKDGENRAKVEGHLALLRAALDTPSDTPPDTPSDTPSEDRQQPPPIPHRIPTGAGAGASSALEVTDPLCSSPVGAATRKRGTRLAPSWQPTQEQIDFALSLRLDPQRTAATFRDYWCDKTGKDATKVNWDGTWRNWCRRDADRRQPAARPSTTDQRVQAGLDLAARFAAEDGDPAPRLRMLPGRTA